MLYLLPPSLIVALLHIYLFRRLVRDTQLAAAPRRAAMIGLTLLGASIPITFLTWGFVSRSAGPALSALAFGWMGLTVYLVGLLVMRDVVRVAIWLVTRVARALRVPRVATVAPAVSEPERVLERETRRVFVARAAAGSALVAAGGIGMFGVRSALWDITLPEVPVALSRFPRALDGYTIALLTDVHIGPMLDGRFLRHLVEQTNRMRPDLVAIAGDLVDGRVAQIGAQVAELRHLRARHGVFFVTGNHEYYSGGAEWIDFLPQLGVRVLMNERVSLGDRTPQGAHFDLAGIPDHRALSRSNIGPDARAATLGRDPERELVMLAHQPVQIADTARVGTGLQLSGHTHGGQLYPFGAVALLAQPYLAGLHRHAASGTQVYVSRGTGFWGPPMRVLAPAEIALVRLHSA
jgi:predicted MPP superfamily phosphohydrolase